MSPWFSSALSVDISEPLWSAAWGLGLIGLAMAMRALGHRSSARGAVERWATRIAEAWQWLTTTTPGAAARPAVPVIWAPQARQMARRRQLLR